MTAGTLNPRLRDIAEEFTALHGRERLQLLLEYADALPALPARYAEHRDLLEQAQRGPSWTFPHTLASAEPRVGLRWQVFCRPAPPRACVIRQPPGG